VDLFTCAERVCVCVFVLSVSWPPCADGSITGCLLAGSLHTVSSLQAEASVLSVCVGFHGNSPRGCVCTVYMCVCEMFTGVH